MSSIYNDDSLTLHTDLYQINMMKTYWETGVYEKKAIFEAYFRKLPFENGYAIFAGLERIVRYIEQLRFSKTDIEYLRGLGHYPEEFLTYLENFEFKGRGTRFRERTTSASRRNACGMPINRNSLIKYRELPNTYRHKSESCPYGFWR